MRAKSIMRFVALGAVGFGLGGAIAGACWPLAVLTSGASALLFILSGAVGGASLGLALGDRATTTRLALLGILGYFLGGIVALVIALGFLSASEEYGTRGMMGVSGGAIIGASLALTFGAWERIIALALAGAVGFGAGVLIGVFVLKGIFGGEFLVGVWGTIVLYAITGTIGGASLGAALGYLEKRKLAEERRPRVR
jgi:hypothetical protein